jgi:hypothetical protein
MARLRPRQLALDWRVNECCGEVDGEESTWQQHLASSGNAQPATARAARRHQRSTACGGNDASPTATSGTSPAPTSAATASATAATLSRGEAARLFSYDRRRPLAITETQTRKIDGTTVHSIIYASPKGGPVPALVVVPDGKGPFAGVIVQHGLPGTKEEMRPVGIDLARSGAVASSWTPFNRPEHGPVGSDPLTGTPRTATNRSSSSWTFVEPWIC